MRFIIFTLLIVFSQICLGTAPGGQLNKAMRSYVAGNNEVAAKELELLAKQGDPVAQFWLSEIYSKGQGVPKDDFIAFKWCNLSAEKRNALAMHKLGFMYFYGQGGVAQNYQEAFKWFERNSTWPGSQSFLGEMYAQGYYVNRDLTKAKEWFKKSCNNGIKMGCERAQILAAAAYGV